MRGTIRGREAKGQPRAGVNTTFKHPGEEREVEGEPV